MLTRLRVQGFKNLVDVDVHFGPFTCIAGANGVGKSNLFDAITFLSKLATESLLGAARSIRDETGKTGDIRSLFHRVGDNYAGEMSFDAEMIVPLEATDDLGQKASATITFLRYELTLGYKTSPGSALAGGLEIKRESLTHIKKGEARKHIRFPHKKLWRDTAVTGISSGHRTAPFISTEDNAGGLVIKIHQDGGSSGKPRSFAAADLPRTVLSASTNSAEGPTVSIARREMQSWYLLQLEPSSLRKPSLFTDPPRLGMDGSHLAATLFHLAQMSGAGAEGIEKVYASVANRVAELIEDIRDVRVDKDERRELLTVSVTGRDGTIHAARALSDGTLRFLALAVLELDPGATGVLCLEEPENGIHPARIPAMLELLESIGTDPTEAISDDNPLRQVLVNTHSPAVVGSVTDDAILFAHLEESVRDDGQRFRHLQFSSLRGTWRCVECQMTEVARGRLVEYLNPTSVELTARYRGITARSNESSRRRVADRDDLQRMLAFEDAN